MTNACAARIDIDTAVPATAFARASRQRPLAAGEGPPLGFSANNYVVEAAGIPAITLRAGPIGGRGYPPLLRKLRFECMPHA
jgi:hypothetical protein